VSKIAGEIQEGFAKASRVRPEWETRAEGIPALRYTDREFAALEAEKLWPHVWQMACREDEVSRPGDFAVYDILEDSIVVVRVDEHTVKAYHNVCPHRATALAVGSGRFTGQIVCPFHGWRWNLKGENTFILDQREFCGGKLRHEDVALKEVRVAHWMGSVWINMDANAPSFEEHIKPIKALIDPLGLENMRFHWWRSMRVPCNWKVAQEAFHEAYHLPQTHPQVYEGRHEKEELEAWTGSLEYIAHPNGHGHFKATASTRIAPVKKRTSSGADADFESMLHFYDVQEAGMDAIFQKEEIDLLRTLRHRKIPQGQSLYDAFMDVVYEHYKHQGRPIGDRAALAECTDAFIFPNVTFLPAFGNALIYRSRPSPDNDPNFCEFELYSLKSYADGEASPQPKVERIGDPSSPKSFRLIPRQDFANVPRQQRGLRSRAVSATRLSGRQEVFIANMHRHLDQYLQA
jgi:phenylpropionate dioxygenase-like ring-hydroxylating dioxygenase large terminal subunit